MILSHRQTQNGPRWALDGRFLNPDFSLGLLLSLPQQQIQAALQALISADKVQDEPLLAPLEDHQEVWASGVTYLRSREARVHESDSKDVYEKVYDAVRPELFFKANGWRAKASGESIRIRQDSHWNVPEPELTLVINSTGEIVGYTAGNDVSSRDIEGENPLYLPQAKVYNGSCALGPGIVIDNAEAMQNLIVTMQIRRAGQILYDAETSISQMKRPLQELADYLLVELDLPHGALLMTGAGIVPDDDFTLQAGDEVRITVGDLVLENSVQQ